MEKNNVVLMPWFGAISENHLLTIHANRFTTEFLYCWVFILSKAKLYLIFEHVFSDSLILRFPGVIDNK